VRYIYETPPQTEAADAPALKQEDLIVDALAELPADLASNLEQAVMNIDLDTTSNIIKLIREQEAALADTLKECVDNFEYEKVLKMIQREPEDSK